MTSIATQIPPMDQIVRDLTWWTEFVAEAEARGDKNRVPQMKRAALALQAQGYSPNMAVHTLF